MPKIYFIANARIPTEKAHGKQIMKTCEALARQKVQVELWLPHRKQLDQLANQDPFAYYGCDNSFIIKTLPVLDFLKISGNWPSFLQTAVYFLEEFSFLVSLTAKMPSESLIYTRSMTAAAVLKLFKKCRVYYEVHNVTQNTLSWIVQRNLWRMFDGVTAISDGLKSRLEMAGISRVIVVPDAVDLQDFGLVSRKDTRGKLKIGSDERVVLYSGSLQSRKGVYVLAQAAKENKSKNLWFWFVGGTLQGTDVSEFRQYISRKEISNVVVTGYIPAREVAAYLVAADVLVLPSSAKVAESNLYTSPMKLFEYLAAGVPIVASATKANREILINGKNALLVLPDNPKDLLKGIRKVLTDKYLADRICRAAVTDAKKYSWDKRAAKIADFVIK